MLYIAREVFMAEIERYNLAEFLPTPKRLKKSYTPDYASFQPGSIIRCKLTNFMSYKFTEFHFGPHMNLIIGPNGTGKSTFVCAVCIGLGGKLINLGKESMNTDDFIKDTEDYSEIELELKDMEGDETFLITSELRRKQKTKWFVNKVSVSEQEVKRLLKVFNIQLDNLCQFLPQDRVSKFADLKGEDLLKEIERCYQNGELLDQHEEIISLKSELSTKIKYFDDANNMLKELREKNQMLADNVERHRKFLELQEELKQLELVLPYVEYQDIRSKRDTAYAEFEAARVDYEEFINSMAPLESQLQSSGENLKIIKEKVTQLNLDKANYKKDAEMINKKSENIGLQISRIFSDIEDFESKLKDAQKSYIATKQEIKLIEDDLLKLDTVSEDDLSSFKDKRLSIRNEMMEIEERISTERGGIAPNERLIERLKNQIMDEQRKLTSTDRLNLLDSRKFHKTIEAVKLLRKLENRSNVFEPAIISINIKDAKIAAIAEAIIPQNVLNAVVVKNRDEYNRMSSYLYDKYKCTISMRTLGDNFDIENDRIDRETMKKLGFDGFLSDFLNGPKEIIQMLCENAFINKIPISIRGLSSAQKERISNEVEADRLNLVKYVSDEQIYTMNRSKFGRKQVFTNIKSFDTRSTVFSSGLSEEQRLQINERINSLNGEINTLKTAINESREAVNLIKKERDDKAFELSDVEAQIHRLLMLKKQRSKLEHKVEMCRAKLVNENVNNGRSGKFDEIQKLLKEKDELLKTKREIQIKRIKIDSQLLRASISLLEQENRIASVESLAESISFQKENKKNAVRKCKSLYEESKVRFKKVQHEYKAKVAELTPEERASLSTRIKLLAGEVKTEDGENSGLNKEKIMLQLDQVRSEMQLHARSGGEGSVERLAENETKLKELEEQLPEKEVEINQLKEDIREKSDLWEKELRKVVRLVDQDFSENMSQIASGGGVALVNSSEPIVTAIGDPTNITSTTTNSTNNEWKLEIRVSFRDGQEPTLFNGAQHSGGEKSTTTAVFLNSLQGLTRTPFRVVDEINQGLDARNERRVHEMIVRGVEKENSSQYFLITPKLLSDLHYSRAMKVHCIFAGNIYTTTTRTTAAEPPAAAAERSAGGARLPDPEMGVVSNYAG
ncbi:hypothetical protein CANINC_000265 [Pichia inconspicua]|uniref:Structural maintenance of chromosomes protein 5 n=1 Tax=Pichia inconspicua TaxID=52247 RepID=A0A4T0X7V3_9ASCO|nr:hypothetical protein CANINC_000265 [[Candida] inconspicua]